MITDKVYDEYLYLLLDGKRTGCTRIIQDQLDQAVQIKMLYTDLFQRSLYRVGELWESNRISVAKEHLATAITEGLMGLTYPALFGAERYEQGKKIVISCAANEFHQIGGKMVADICELNGWDTHFLGANTPVDHMLEYIQDTKPELVGLSLSVYFNMASLQTGLEAIRSDFRNLSIIVGQAFQWGGSKILKKYSGIEYISSLDELENGIKE
jgi:methanogenic corrinoid protein MtbC1